VATRAAVTAAETAAGLEAEGSVVVETVEVTAACLVAADSAAAETAAGLAETAGEW
jgi:hypothetical protein